MFKCNTFPSDYRIKIVEAIYDLEKYYICASTIVLPIMWYKDIIECNDMFFINSDKSQILGRQIIYADVDGPIAAGTKL